jgi:hypothetical protein
MVVAVTSEGDWWGECYQGESKIYNLLKMKDLLFYISKRSKLAA